MLTVARPRGTHSYLGIQPFTVQYSGVAVSAGVAPVLSNASLSEIASTSVTVSCDTDYVGTANSWIVVATSSATQPTATQISNGQDHTGTLAPNGEFTGIGIGTNSTSVTGLSAGTQYYFHTVLIADEVESNIVTAGPQTTPASSSDDDILRLRDGTYRRRFSWGV